MLKIGLIFSMTIFAFLKAEATKIKGQIIYDRDTVEVLMNIPTTLLTQEVKFEKIQQKIKYFDSEGNKKTVRPDDAKEIRFLYQSEEVRMVSVRNTLGLGNIFNSNENIFLKIEIDDRLKLFRYYQTQRSSGMYNANTGMTTGGFSYSVENYVLQKGNGQLTRPVGLSFKKDMIKFFNDCPKLSRKIEEKEFRKRDIEAIVLFYNENCN
ncbi:MAG: putative Zn-ribbon and HTH transcriptional regulator [Bacteroidia bacterium]|jgi:predicted Zn-ribbon and HTH transcriptional regulator